MTARRLSSSLSPLSARHLCCVLFVPRSFHHHHRVMLVEAAKAHTPLTALLHSALWKHTPPKLVNVLERLRKVNHDTPTTTHTAAAEAACAHWYAVVCCAARLPFARLPVCLSARLSACALCLVRAAPWL